ncbi:MAG: hydrogenase nickel incorporation protein HypB [Candidatus Omnitrophica bacterium]|nr:hydrogenase nickel incorporation protein HypB [Candidatus Omnitrophota bacterium]
MSKTIQLEKKVQSKSAEIAEELHQFFCERGIFVVNLIGSPGAGKTSLLEAMAPRLKGQAAVIEGDLQTDEDKQRIEKAGLPAYEINTVGACHLDAKMIRAALDEFPLGKVKYLFIENIGNLVCPAGFALGEDFKVSIISVAEGHDKPAKYPTALRNSRAMVITKTDLLPYIPCDINRMENDALAVNPDLKLFRTSTGEKDSTNAFLDWIAQEAESRHKRLG